MSVTLIRMQNKVFYASICGFTLGIFLRSFVAIGVPFILLGVVVGGGLLLLGRRKSFTFSSAYLALFSVCIIAFSLGLFRMNMEVLQEKNAIYESQLEQVLTLEGAVVQEPDIRESSQHLYVQVADELLLVTTDRYAEVSYGDRITFSGKLSKPGSFETDLGRTFDYPGYLHARGVSYVVSFAKVTLEESGKGNVILSALLQFKHAFMTRIETVMSEPYVGLGEGLLLGVSQALGADLEDAFRKTGIIHIVVLSGYNIMLVVLFVLYMLSLVFPLRLRLIFGVISIFLFACMVGLSPTVLRASAMAVLLLLAQATGRTYAVLRALLITGVLMLLLNPYLLVYDVGFQFSFIATLGLILVSPHLSSYVTFVPTWFGLREFLTATLATQIFITPILLYQMGQFSVVSVVVNLLVLPMVPVAMFLTFITGLVGFFSTTLSLIFGYMATTSLLYIIKIAEKFAELPFASVVVPQFPFYIVIIIYGIYTYILWRLYVRSMLPSQIHTDSLDGWVIVDEADCKILDIESQSDSMLHTPIFFR